MKYAANERVTGILLAAGSSRRFGGDKQSAILDGVPIVVRAARLLLEAGLETPIVVLGPRAAEHRALLAGLPLRLAENPDAASGMASSLAVALNAARTADAADDCDAILVTVCDQPAVTAAHLRKLVARWRSGGCTIVASRYGGALGVPALGVPALFGATHFTELRQLRGDRGAGPLLATHAATTAAIDLPQGEVDIDTPQDLAHLRRISGSDQ